ncbi:type II secretion system protein [Helicobacter sp. MIT 14-3879]|uniref:type II secretion system protein n=1 Tax=Helicobacter sp. MIT 14-3879 TaxID=2040649 RepID=UPI000E1E6F36|nr:hypothetical protein [Helicobacter sp. MIT 14-3879]RDU65217.1 hypothetical protein CQA44_02575 [Helicobacter sp. MIT 14-3879]
MIISKKYKFNKNRSSFTMLELVFVIVITGLVSVAGAMAINQILQNYALQKEYAKLELDSASAIRQISKYIQNSIWDSISIKTGNNYIALSSISEPKAIDSNAGTQITFIEKNMDSINGRFVANQNANIPYFSGFIDLNNSGVITNATTGKTQDGNIIVAAFASDDIRPIMNTANISLYFPFVNAGSKTTQLDKYYSNNTRNRSAIFRIISTSNRVITLENSPLQIGDIGVIVNTNPTNIIKNANGDLLISQQPQNARNETVIANNVSNLYLWTEANAGLIRVRICFNNRVIKSVMNEFCKEGVILQ